MYHVNPQTGNPGVCKAEAKGCPFGGTEEHFTSKDAARAHYEDQMKSGVLEPSSVTKAKSLISRPKDRKFGEPVFVNAFAAELALEAWDKKASEEEKAKYSEELEAHLKSQESSVESDLHVQRISRMMGNNSDKSMKELLTTNAVTEKDEVHQLSQGVKNLVEGFTYYPAKAKEAFYATPAKYLETFASSHSYKAHSAPAIEAIARIAQAVHAKDPKFDPDFQRFEPPSRVSGRVAHNEMMQMQNVSPQTYGLLKRYVSDKYGAEREKEFWETVRSESVNYPKITDFIRAEKAFDSK